jgi:hygromycin-B 7''-O-kinase
MPLHFTSVHEYGQQFTDVAVWRHAVERVCQRHHLAVTSIQAGLAGTHPVFLIDTAQPFVVKFYETRFFAGARSYHVERDLYQWLPSALAITIPQLLASGTLEDDGSWPYIITSLVPGSSFGAVRQQVSALDTNALAILLGQTLGHLHRIPITTSPFLVWLHQEYDQFISRQLDRCVAHHQQWNTLPAHLIAQIPRYLADHERINAPVPPCLIHADLTHDHVLGAFKDGHWCLTGLIDFGDAWVGDWIYELVALHLSVFQLDQQLLQTFLTAYTSDDVMLERFVERAMVATLVFEFNAFETIAEHRPAALTVATLEELAVAVWSISDK